MDKASSVIEEKVTEHRKQVEVMDKFQPVKEAEPAKVTVKQTVIKPQPKKSLTDSVLDTISKLLEK